MDYIDAMDNEKLESEKLEIIKAALLEMEVVRQEYIKLAVIMVDVVEIVKGNEDDDAEIGRRIKRLLEDYAK